jgi:hypothetical protein
MNPPSRLTDRERARAAAEAVAQVRATLDGTRRPTTPK